MTLMKTLQFRKRTIETLKIKLDHSFNFSSKSNNKNDQ